MRPRGAHLTWLGAGLGLFVSLGLASACGTDVNLGGGADAGGDVVFVPEASDQDAPTMSTDPVALCEPCATAATCPASATCAQIVGTPTFCALLCPLGTECQNGDSCKVVPSYVAGQTVHACVPAAGSCEPAKPPTADGTVVDRCGTLDGPTIVAECKSCDKDDKDCQRNGCYGGWWCDTATRKCQKPPARCS